MGNDSGTGTREQKLRLAVVCGLTLAVLLPFAHKAFHVDDTLFLYSARQILREPLRPYESTLNWNGTPELMWNVTKNPPLAAYLLASVTGVFGESEVPAHVVFMLFAVLAVAAAGWLGMGLGIRPAWPAALLAASPGFLVTATGVSSDLVALSLYVLAVAAFVHGSRDRRWSLLILAGVAAGLSSVTKYLGVSVIPLLAVYSVIRERRVGRPLLALLIAPAIFGLWGLYGLWMHGEAHFLTGASYVGATRGGAGEGEHRWLLHAFFCVATLSFFAGAVGPAILLPLRSVLRRRSLLLLAGAAAGGSIVIMAWMSRSLGLAQLSTLNSVWLLLLVFGAVCFTGWAVRTGGRWSPERWLLVLWIVGVLLFSAFFNWTTAVRTVLFAIPPAALLMGEAMDRRWIPRGWALGLALAGGVVAVALCAADYRWAEVYRRAADEAVRLQAVERQDGTDPARIFFHAHWGLQYYLELRGADFYTRGTERRKGDLLVTAPMAHKNAALERFLDEQVLAGNRVCLPELVVHPLFGIEVQNRAVGTGFYSCYDGALPYGFATVPCETVRFYRVP